jgi:peptide/nickel transport system substrate-binding protein
MAEIKAGGSRNRTIAIILAIVVVVAGAFVVSGKSGSKSGTIYYITNAKQLNHLDPQRVYTGEDIAFLNSYLFRTLVSYNPVAGKDSSKLVPDLATDIGTATDGGKTWSWTLKSGIKWSDGTDLTCDDVKYGISRIFATDVIVDGPTYALQLLDIPTDAKGASAYAGPYKKTGQELYDKAVTCSGNTITMHLKKPVGDFNYFGSYPAVAPVKQSADTGDKYDLNPMGTGPYMIASFKAGDKLDLVRNKYWDKKTDAIRPAYPNEVILRFGISEDVRDQIFLKDSQPNAVNYDEGLQAQNNNNKIYHTDPKNKDRGINVLGPFVRYWTANVAKGHLDCLPVRKAIFFALNLQSLIDLAGGSDFYGAPADSPVSPTIAADYAPTTGNIHDPNWKITGNPDYAKTLLAQAKTSCPATYAKATQSGIYFDMAKSATNDKAAALIKSAMDAAGMVAKFNLIEPGVYYPTVMNPAKQGDVTRAGWAADWANASTVIPPLFIKDGGFNLNQNWDDPGYKDFAAKVAAAQGETDRAKQADEWKSLAQYVMDQYWTIMPVFTKQQFEWGSKIAGADFWMPNGALLYPSMHLK